jgi:hypothetical protein
MSQYFTELSVSRILKVKSLSEGQRASVGQMLDRMLHLEGEGLTSINLYNCWLVRRLIPLQWHATDVEIHRV